MPHRSIIRSSSLYKWGQRRAFAAKLIGYSGSQPLSLAIKKTSSNTLTKDEQRAIADIEEVRTSLEQNQNVIVIRDYGAGSPNEHHSCEEIDEGVIKHRKIGDICKSASKSQLWCLFMFHLIRQFKPIRCVEMGTCLGISASFISSALRLNGFGRLVSLEGSPQQAEIARATFHQLGLNNVTVRVGRFKDTLVPALNEMKPVSFVFVDGHHDEGATCLYFDTIRQYLDVENVIIFDDIRWSEGMKTAWRYVRARSEAYDLGSVGACINVGAVSQMATASRPKSSVQS
jgi:predicted O-methyltransferase YrrM